MDGIVRSETGDKPREATADRGRRIVWISRRGTHLGQQRSLHKQAGHMHASERTPEKISRQTLRARGRPHMLCADAVKSSLPARYVEHLPPGGFGTAIRAFAVAARELQQKRHQADYDPVPRFKTADARVAIKAAREAVAYFQTAPEPEKKTFLTLLVCPPR